MPREPSALGEFLAQYGNDLTQAAVDCAPVIANVLEALRALPDAVLVRMSGSGATCFAVFPGTGEAAAAARRLQARHKNWWVFAGTLG